MERKRSKELSPEQKKLVVGALVGALTVGSLGAATERILDSEIPADQEKSEQLLNYQYIHLLMTVEGNLESAENVSETKTILELDRVIGPDSPEYRKVDSVEKTAANFMYVPGGVEINAPVDAFQPIEKEVQHGEMPPNYVVNWEDVDFSSYDSDIERTSMTFDGFRVDREDGRADLIGMFNQQDLARINLNEMAEHGGSITFGEYDAQPEKTIDFDALRQGYRFTNSLNEDLWIVLNKNYMDGVQEFSDQLNTRGVAIREIAHADAGKNEQGIPIERRYGVAHDYQLDTDVYIPMGNNS